MNIIIEILSFLIGIILFTLLFGKRNEEVEENPTPSMIDIYVEKIGDIYYAWHDKNFLYQSKDSLELVKHINSKFPKNLIKITSDKELTWLQEAKRQLNLN